VAPGRVEHWVAGAACVRGSVRCRGADQCVHVLEASPHICGELALMFFGASVFRAAGSESFAEKPRDVGAIILRMLTKTRLMKLCGFHGHDCAVPGDHIRKAGRQGHVRYTSTALSESFANTVHQIPNNRLGVIVEVSAQSTESRWHFIGFI